MSPPGPAALGPAGAFGLGLLTSLNPCPLAAELAALGLVAGWGGTIGRQLLRGLSLVAGLTAAYAGLACLLAAGLLQGARLGSLLSWVEALQAPLLIAAGLLMTGLFRREAAAGEEDGLPGRLAARPRGLVSAFGVGAFLALSFCPVTAGIFFAVLMPAALAGGTPILSGLAYGLGAGLPLLLAVLAAAAGLRLALPRKSGRPLTMAAGWTLVALGAWLTWRRM